MTGTTLRRAVRHALLFSSLVASVAAITPAFAADEEEKQPQEVVVTGSRIARPNLESTVPITTVSAEEIFQTGNTSVGDLLNDLPALRSTFSQSNSSRFLGTAGLNLLDLRGLGTQRTLVLVNGRRHVGNDILGNAVSPDVNTIPSDLIERIDVVTGGNSAVYGSDAIAGVVNFILKKNFEGLQLRGQGGESTYHDAGSYFASAVWGTNFMDNRGNVAVNLEYAAQKAFFASDRPNLARPGGFVTIDSDGPGFRNGSDGNVDRIYVGDIRFTSISTGGLLQFAPVDTALAPNAPCGRDPQGLAYRCTYLFQPDGSLVPQTGTRVGLGPSGNFNGGNGTTNREGTSLGIFPKLNRYSFNLIGHLDITDAFSPFIEAKYVHTDSLSFGSPAFFQGSTIDAFYERPRFDNPFLSTSAQLTIQAARAAAGIAPATAGTRLLLMKNLLDLGDRQEEAKRDTMRIVLGVNGKLSSDWSYEFSVNYGKFKESTKVEGNLNVQRFTIAMDAVRDPATNNIVCGSKLDITRVGPYSSDPFAVAAFPGDVAACIPLNPFGDGSITPAMRNYLAQDTTSIGDIKEFDVNAFVTGNSAAWFSLPGGPIGVAFGAEYRTEENYFKADDLVASGNTFYNALPLFNPDKFVVKEVYAEFRMPIVKDKPFFDELTASLAGRAADYKGSTGRVNAYNMGLDWAPVHDLRFRAGFARAVRAPNLSDLFSVQSQNFAFVNDPCSTNFIGNGPNRAANCAAVGVPAGGFVDPRSATLEILSGGNPDLKAEVSRSFTGGFVLQPSFVPGFTFSADYFEINIDDLITAPSAQQIVDACFDSPTANNQFCGLFRRQGPGIGPKGEVQFQILEGSLQQTLLNYARRTATGIDFEVAYKHTLGSLGTFNSHLIYTKALQRNDYLNPANPGFADQILMELGDPKDTFNLDFGFSHDRLDLGWKIHFIGQQVINTYENIFSVQGRPPENSDYASVRFYPAVWYHDVRAAFDITSNVNAYAGVDNLFNRIPPFGATGTGGGSAIYDARGRFYYAGVKWKM